MSCRAAPTAQGVDAAPESAMSPPSRPGEPDQPGEYATERSQPLAPLVTKVPCRGLHLVDPFLRNTPYNNLDKSNSQAFVHTVLTVCRSVDNHHVQPRRPSQQPQRMSRRSFAAASAAALAAVVLPTRADDSSDLAVSPSLWSGVRDVSRRLLAADMESGMREYESNMATRKRELFSSHIPESSVVLDVGIGTAPSLVHLPRHVSVIGIDPNPYMLPYAQRRAASLQIPFQFLTASATQLPLQSNSVDVAITTLVLCSVSDPHAALSEIIRVLKPNGVYIFVEHILASEQRPVLQFAQHVLTPLQRLLADGCNLDRRSDQLIRDVFTPFADTLQLDYFDARLGGVNDLLSPIRPHVAGFVRLKS